MEVVANKGLCREIDSQVLITFTGMLPGNRVQKCGRDKFNIKSFVKNRSGGGMTPLFFKKCHIMIQHRNQ